MFIPEIVISGCVFGLIVMPVILLPVNRKGRSDFGMAGSKILIKFAYLH